jgi:phage shock protein PspC (stress-responsive transcriptional regulator)
MTAHTTYKELQRSRSDRMLGGVCGGLGQYFDVNPVFYRVGFVILTLLGGAGLLVYGAAVLVIPDEGQEDSIAADVLKHHRQRPVALAGLGLVAVAGIALLSRVSWHFHSGTFWIVVLIVGASLLWAQRQPRQPSDAPETVARTPPTTIRRNTWRWLRITLGTIGVMIALALATVAAFAVPHLHLGDGIGNRSYQPATLAAVHGKYKLGVGYLKLDLSQLDLGAKTRPTTIHARLGTGDLEVIVPRDATVLTYSRVVWGDARILGHEDSGHDVTSDVGESHPQLVLDARVGIGDIEVKRP